MDGRMLARKGIPSTMTMARLGGPAMVLSFGLLLALPAGAGISYTGLNTSQYYTQTNTGPSFSGISMSVGINVASPSDFTGASVLIPGQTSAMSIAPWNLTEMSDGTYGASSYTLFSDTDVSAGLAAKNAAFPFGTYTITAINSITNLQQQATLDYDADYWPTVPDGSGQTAVPALTAGTYAGLQGMNAGSPFTLNFNTFTGSAVTCCGQVDPSTTIYIVSATSGQAVYTSPTLTDGTSSLILPANTLQPNTSYYYDVYFRVNRSCGGNQSCGTNSPFNYFLLYQVRTSGEFTTAATTTPAPTTVTLQGGTMADPVPLQSEGRLGQVNGSIGGEGAMDFYVFYWAGGAFQANVSLTGANKNAEYEFQLLNYYGLNSYTASLIQDMLLNQSNNFTAGIGATLPAGTYEIGVLADSAADPSFTISFDTPVQGAVVSVPNVVGFSPSAAASAITGAGLTVGNVSTASSLTVPSGDVLTQSPASGAIAARGSAVSLIESLPGDLNDDGVVGCADLAIVKASFGKKSGQPGFNAVADLNGDGVVNILDLSTEARLMPAGTVCQ